MEKITGFSINRALTKPTFAWLIYFFFFILLFLQFPISKSLPGKVDTWFHLAIFNGYENELKEWILGEWNGTPYYPEKTMIQFGEPTPGNGVIFLFFRFLGFSNLHAYFLFTAFLFSLNGMGMFLLVRSMGGKPEFSFVSGFFFSASCFAFGQLDHPNTGSWAFALFSLTALNDFIGTEQNSFAVKSTLFAVIQIYFSGYIFIYLIPLLFLFGILAWKKLKVNLIAQKKLLLLFPLFIIFISPYLYAYVANPILSNSYNPAIEFRGAEISNLKPFDLLRSLPGNILYGDQNYEEYPLLNSIRSANVGIFIWVLALAGIARINKTRFLFLGIFSIGLILAIGPYMDFGKLRFPFILYPAYEWGLAQFLRTPVRAFSVILIFLSASSALFLQDIFENKNIKPLFLIIPILLFSIENIPMPFRKYDSWKFIEPNPDYISVLKNKGKVLVELPSGIFLGKKQFTGSLDEINREHIYAFWQTFHKLNIPNGSSGFFPSSRLKTNSQMINLSKDDNLRKLIFENEVDFIAWHKNMLLDFETEENYSFLKSQLFLEIILNNNELTVFKVRKELFSVE